MIIHFFPFGFSFYTDQTLSQTKDKKLLYVVQLAGKAM